MTVSLYPLPVILTSILLVALNFFCRTHSSISGRKVGALSQHYHFGSQRLLQLTMQSFERHSQFSTQESIEDCIRQSSVKVIAVYPHVQALMLQGHPLKDIHLVTRRCVTHRGVS
ncbi:hypothetical protein BV25DRAFT_1193402 [Artomyces pyxidatus]|uniref:Uncharacterized protein n=1 Tax=Artomyces pyxidatus TaxID=48021 RepID=A0ACB8SS01_9AGAM|nr:hypothetical protein BV25DRAFT_1193402 [Artomyces pyxidatus]